MDGVAVSVSCTRRRQQPPPPPAGEELGISPAELLPSTTPAMAAKIILKMEMNGDKDKQKVFKAVSSLQGIDSVSVDIEGQRLTMVGLVDPVALVAKLRKAGVASIVSVGPAKKEKDGTDEEPNYCAIC